MITSADLHGVMGMMPAFATDDAGDIRARSTIHLENLRDGVNRMIGDGIDVIATTGSFGEFHTLLRDEYETLARATVEVVNRRVPLFVGCTGLNSREVVDKMAFIDGLGADGVLVGVPFYFPSTVENAIQFYHDIAEMFPQLGIMIYHNPPLHNITIPVDAFRKLTENPNIVAMKDSHRDTPAFIKLQEIIRGKMSVFVNQAQYYPFALLGAAGCWSIDSWMGPWPLLRLRDAVNAGDMETAREITSALAPSGAGGPPDLRWRETAAKISQHYAGYVKPGPLRPPFVNVPDAVMEGAKKRAVWWNELCAKYRPVLAAV